VFILQANDQRLADAKAYLQSLPKMVHSTATNVDSIVDAEQYSLVITVITMSRGQNMTTKDQQMYNLGYLSQTVARLLQIINTDSTASFQHVKLFICNVDTQPKRFAEALDLSGHVQIVSRYQNTTAKLTTNLHEKEKDDYVYCLHAASQFTSPYYLVLEDDVLLDVNAVESVYFVMNYFDLFSATDWLFLKLYYPQKWSGYGRNVRTVVELISYSLLSGFLCASVIWLMPRCCKCRVMPVWFWFAVGVGFAPLLCVCIGRQYVESWRHYFSSTHQLVAAPGCCTQATLYPALVISDLCAHLAHVRSHAKFPVDIAVDSFAHIHGLKRYLIEPNVVKHIGLISSLSKSPSAKFFL